MFSHRSSVVWLSILKRARSHARFALASVAAIVSTSCSPDSGLSTPFVPDNWAELCASRDCEQFPVGYLTRQVGRYFFYFAIASTDVGALPDADHLYVQRGADGVALRAALLNPRNRTLHLGAPCCVDLAKRLGVPGPKSAGYIAPVDLEFFAGQKVSSSFPAEHGRLLSFASPEELRSRQLPSFDANFWLVQDGGVLDGRREGGRHRLLLISKEPLLYGRHVALDCRVLCNAETVTFSGDPQRVVQVSRLVELSTRLRDRMPASPRKHPQGAIC